MVSSVCICGEERTTVYQRQQSTDLEYFVSSTVFYDEQHSTRAPWTKKHLSVIFRLSTLQLRTTAFTWQWMMSRGMEETPTIQHQI